jgi:hypothetical protein
VVAENDPHLRRPSLWERLWHRSRFLAAEQNKLASRNDGMVVAGN